MIRGIRNGYRSEVKSEKIERSKVQGQRVPDNVPLLYLIDHLSRKEMHIPSFPASTLSISRVPREHSPMEKPCI